MNSYKLLNLFLILRIRTIFREKMQKSKNFSVDFAVHF